MVFRFLQVESFEDLQDGRVMLEMVRVIAGGGEGAVTTPMLRHHSAYGPVCFPSRERR